MIRLNTWPRDRNLNNNRFQNFNGVDFIREINGLNNLVPVEPEVNNLNQIVLPNFNRDNLLEIVNDQRENFREAAHVIEEINFNVMNLQLINWKLVFGGVVLLIGSLWLSSSWLSDWFISFKNLSWSNIFKKAVSSVVKETIVTSITTTSSSGEIKGFIGINNPKPWDTNNIYAFLMSLGIVGYKFKRR